MTLAGKQILSYLFDLAGTRSAGREKILADERINEISDADIREIIAVIKTNRRGDFTKPLTADEFVEAHRALRIGKQESLF